MTPGKRWTVDDRYGNSVYLTHERWNHIIENINHPEMLAFEVHLKATVRTGKRTQDLLNPQKFRYTKAFGDLERDNTHIVAIVLFRYSKDASGNPLPNNYIVTAYQKMIG